MLKLNPNNLDNFKKKLFLILFDFIIITISICASYSLRLETLYSIFEIDLKVYFIFLHNFYLIFYINNIYQILLRFFDYFSIKKIIKSSFICLVILVPLNFYFYKEFFFPRSISILAPIIIAILIILHRVFINFLINLNKKNIKNNILVIGLNNQNASIIKNIRGNINSGTIKAVIDTSNLYKQREFNGIQIYKKRFR